MLIGCIADDFTGASDIANTLAQGGMRSVLYSGIPKRAAARDVEAGIVALKTRTIAPEVAVAQSLAAAEWLLQQGCEQIVFKICSTFDSTPDGNIGPVASALAERLDAHAVIVCPAFPGAGRTVYQGHLFVGDRLLSETGMRRHPLTPMEDPDLRRWLTRQTALPVGLVSYDIVCRGAAAISEALAQRGRELVILDAIREDDMREIGVAAKSLPLLVGGSGIAIGLPANYGRRAGDGEAWSAIEGAGLVLAGSCSEATRAQVTEYTKSRPALRINPDEVMAGRIDAQKAMAWVMQNLDSSPLVYASAAPEAVCQAQARHGTEPLATALDGLFASLASRAVAAGVRRLVVAGGETSGAVTQGLGVEALRIGPEIAPGVPATCLPDGSLGLVLKSGNFGDAGFFATALAHLKGRA